MSDERHWPGTVPGRTELNAERTRTPGLKIGLIGSYPPPYGGVTVHIQRLMKKLDEYNIDYVLYDILGGQHEQKDSRIIRIQHPKLWMLKFFFSGSPEIIHNHTTDWRGQVLVGLMGLLGKKTVSTLHSERLVKSWKDYNVIKRKIIQIALQSTTSLIAVNAHIRDFCVSLGVDPDRVFLIPAFIPPEPEEKDLQELPWEIRDFIGTHDPLISANAFKIKFFKNEDVYGIDLCIGLCSRLKQNRDTVGFVFFLPQIGDLHYFSDLQQRIADLHLQDNFLFVTEPYPFYPLLLKSNVFIRPTNTDGDAISLREALYFGVPSVASDVVTRPEGTILFKNRNIDDLTDKVQDLLDNYPYYKQRMNALPPGDYSNSIVQVYLKVAGIPDKPRAG